MNAQLTTYKAGLVIVLILFATNSSLYAQAGSETEQVQRYEELAKYQNNHVIEIEEDQQSFSETMTGIDNKTLGHVFLAELTLVESPDKLKKAESPQEFDEDVPVGDFEFVEYDDLFAGNDSGSGSGFFGSGNAGGHCPPGGFTRY